MMKIDNRISFERAKRVLSLKSIMIVALIVAILTTVLYVMLENKDKREVLIWLVTTDGDCGFSSETMKSINDYGAENGLDRIILTRRDPSDRYFAATMSTTAYYNCDIFIMREDVVKEYLETDMFLPLSTDGIASADLLYYGDNAIGVLAFEDYYLLINNKTDVDEQIMYRIIDILIEK